MSQRESGLSCATREDPVKTKLFAFAHATTRRGIGRTLRSQYTTDSTPLPVPGRFLLSERLFRVTFDVSCRDVRVQSLDESVAGVRLRLWQDVRVADSLVLAAVVGFQP